GGLPPPAPAPSSGPPLRALLGLEGHRKFLLQHQLLSLQRSYRVMTPVQRLLFTLKENSGQELWARLFHDRPAPQPGLHFGFTSFPTRTTLWGLEDAGGNLQGVVEVQLHGNSAVSTLVDGAGAPVLAVQVQRSLIGG